MSDATGSVSVRLSHPVAGGVLALLGAAAMATVVWHVSGGDEPLSALAIGVVPPAILAGIVILAGSWIATSEMDERYTTRLVGWTLLGMVGMGLSAGVLITYQFFEGAVIYDAFFSVGAAATAGMVAGLVVGMYDVRAQRRQAALEAARRQVERSNTQLEALNQILRHDIRNDMNVVLSYGELLEDDIDEGNRERYERLIEKAEHVVELTNTARDIASAAEGEGGLAAVDLENVLHQEVERLREGYPEAAVSLSVEAGVRVRADDLLGSVFRNLLNNAVQHHDGDEPTVDVGIEVREETAVVTVADDGPGIPDELKASVFEHGETGSESTGTGLGLYLVRTLVEQYGGDVDVTDNEPRGTVFHVELPLAE